MDNKNYAIIGTGHGKAAIIEMIKTFAKEGMVVVDAKDLSLGTTFDEIMKQHPVYQITAPEIHVAPTDYKSGKQYRRDRRAKERKFNKRK